MTFDVISLLEMVGLVVGACAASWILRRVIRAMTRRAVRLAAKRPGMWRVRLQRRSELAADFEARRRSRADASARMIGHIVTTLIVVGAAFIGLQIVGVDPVYVISSAGFVGLAIALSGQEIIRNLLVGTMALLEDRYAVGDEVVFSIGGNEVEGIVDLVGPASVRLRTPAGATWHAGHSAIESITNRSQVAATVEILVPSRRWDDVESDAARIIADASNDVGLTGVVFLPGLVATPHPAGGTSVQVKANKPLTDGQRAALQERLLS